MSVHQCHHIMGDGRRCGSPRMNTKAYCFAHTRLHESYLLPGNRYYEAPPLDDQHSVQLALTHVFMAQSRGLITHRQASAMTYNLQIALNNLRNMKPVPPEDMVTEYPAADEDGVGLCGAGLCGADTSVRHDGTSTPAGGEEESKAADISYDEAHPPLCHALGLHPYNAPKPPANSVAFFERPTTDELCKMTTPPDGEIGNHKERADLRRMKLSLALSNIPEPTPTDIARAIAQIEEEEAFLIKDREEEAQRIAHDRKIRKQRELVGL